MKFLVVIDPNSPVGMAYYDVVPKARLGDIRAPALVCTEVAADGLNYLFARTDPSARSGISQSLHIPHHCVLLVVQYDERDPAPLGFSPTA